MTHHYPQAEIDSRTRRIAQCATNAQRAAMAIPDAGIAARVATLAGEVSALAAHSHPAALYDLETVAFALVRATVAQAEGER
jgi:hypothetical protein